MANSLGNYNETFFAQEALIQLEKALGMAARVYRGYDPSPKAKGDTIQIRRPSTFTVQDAPSAAQDVNTENVSIQLNQWKEVKFKLTDKELSLTSEKLISDHIRPAAYALADYIDQQLNALYYQIPNVTVHQNPFVMDDVSAVRKVMQDLKVPVRDGIAFEVGTDVEAFMLNKLAASGMQPGQQDSAIRQGTIGNLFGFDVFANQNTPTHTSGVAADAVGALTVATVKGGSTITFNAVTAAATFKKGDTLTIAGDAQNYVCQADIAADGTGLVTGMQVFPTLKQVNNIGAVVTVTLLGAGKTQHLGFHRNAFALAMAPLSELGAELGQARIATISDPWTNLSLRSRIFYVGNDSAVYVALDVLFGVQTLDPNLAVRMSKP